MGLLHETVVVCLNESRLHPGATAFGSESEKDYPARLRFGA
jgi:hypothetical protein